MRCPYCGYEDTYADTSTGKKGAKRRLRKKKKGIEVIESRDSEDGEAIRRRRICPMCHNRFTTYERIERYQITVIKKSGATEPFDRSKILAGIIKACEKRPVTRERMEAIASRIEMKIRSKGEKEVKSAVIGDMLVKELAKLDPIAYIRFASVYKNFDSPEEFRKAVLVFKRKSRYGD